jgi:predicted DNA-binding transcriptional regulator YafY
MSDERYRGRSGQTIRQLKILLKIKSRAFTVYELADFFSVDTKTIRRDILSLETAGVPFIEGSLLGTDRSTLTRSITYTVLPGWIERFM